jgi:hypothetical protein
MVFKTVLNVCIDVFFNTHNIQKNDGYTRLQAEQNFFRFSF